MYSDSDSALQAFFIDADPVQGGQRFCLYHRPRLAAGSVVKGVVVYLHPFAEEMNKSRRMAALQSRALAQAGFAVLQIDLLGCGDSSGDFGDATWDAWVADAVLAARWLRQRHDAPLWLWGLRAGCLLAVQAAQQVGTPCSFLFWQPPAAGKPLLQQLLRLKLAAGLLGDNRATGVTDDVRARLSAGCKVDIAGYTMSPALAGGLEQARLAPPLQVPRSVWLEATTRADPALLPATQSAVAAWQAAGHDVEARAVTGPAFWQTQEIEDAPALVAATLQAMDACAVAA